MGAGLRRAAVDELQVERFLDAAPVGLCLIDATFRYVTVNRCFAAMYQLPAESFIGKTVAEALPAVAGKIMAHLQQSLLSRAAVEIELEVELLRPDGSTDRRTYMRSSQSLRSTAGELVGFSVALVDITERKRAEAALRESEEHCRFTVELNPHIPWSADANGRLTEISPRFSKLTGRDREHDNREERRRGLHPDDRESTLAAWTTALRTGVPYDHTYRMLCVDGWRWMRARAFPRRDAEGAIVRWYGTLEDIHERKLLDEALEHKTARLEEATLQLSLRVREDHLTGLYNRRHFDDALQREVGRAIRSRQPLAVVMIDVDRFKLFNDTYGHPAGDQCLRAVAGALQKVLRRQGDLAARYGGEEFVLLLPDTHAQGALLVAQQALAAVGALRIEHQGSHTGWLTLSAGVGMHEPASGMEPASTPAGLIASADRALYAAKAGGRNRVVGAQDAVLPVVAPAVVPLHVS